MNASTTIVADHSTLILPDLRKMLRGAAVAAEAFVGQARTSIQAMVSTDGKLDRKALDREQHSVHGFAWYATYSELFREVANWADGLDWYIVHQVSKVHTTMLCDRLGINSAKVPLTFPQYGNVGPAAIPITLAKVQDQIQPGERVLCMGIGSGLNTSLTEILW